MEENIILDRISILSVNLLEAELASEYREEPEEMWPGQDNEVFEYPDASLASRLRMSLKVVEIDNRYNNQDLSWGYHGHYRRRPFTSKQLKRMRKQSRKWRKRIFEE